MDNQQPNAIIVTRKPKRGKGFIYSYTSPSGKIYIGQTIQSLAERAHNGKGYKRCSLFYKAIQKYGFNSFIPKILEETAVENLDEAEESWIEFLNTYRPNGYNLTCGGNAAGRSVKVYQYDCESGLFLNEFNSMTEAAKSINANSIAYISKCLRKEQKSAHGYIWDKERFDKVSPVNYIPNKAKPIYSYNLDGTFHKEYPSITQAALAVDGNRADIKKNMAGQIKFSKGFIWKDTYFESVEPVVTGKNGSIKVKQINPETNLVIQIYESQSKAAKAVGLKCSTGIARACKTGGQSAGFKWEIV